MILLLPFALVGGLFWGIAADKIAKDKEPWFTMLMLCGLAISVVVMASLSGASFRVAAWVYLGTAVLYVGLRCLFGKGSALEMFFVPHLLVITILLLWPALERVRHKAPELRKPNKTVETNRRPALAFDTGREFGWAACAPPGVPGGGRSPHL
jgi:hypothetical protein